MGRNLSVAVIASNTGPLNKLISSMSTANNPAIVRYTVPGGVDTIYATGCAAGGVGSEPTTYNALIGLYQTKSMIIGIQGPGPYNNKGNGAFQYNGGDVYPMYAYTGSGNYYMEVTYTSYHGSPSNGSNIMRYCKVSPTGKLAFVPKTYYMTTDYNLQVANIYRYGSTKETIYSYAAGTTGVGDTIIVSDDVAAYANVNGIRYTDDGWETIKTLALTGGPTTFQSNSSTYTVDNFRRIRYFDNKLMLVGMSDTVGFTNNYVISVDLLTGEKSTDIINSDGTALYDIAYNGDMYVAVGASGAIYRCSTLDGIWAKVTVPAISTTNIRTIEVGNGTFVIGGDAGLVFSSTDGETWTQRSTGLTQKIGDYCIAYHEQSDKWFATSRDSTVTNPGYLRSCFGTDMSVWTQELSLPYGHNGVSVSNDGSICTISVKSSTTPSAQVSYDGISWSSATFSNCDLGRGGATVIHNETTGEELLRLVGGAHGYLGITSGKGRGGSSYGIIEAGGGEGGVGGPGSTDIICSLGTTAVYGAQPDSRNSTSPRAGAGCGPNSFGAGVGIDISTLPVEGWPRKLAGGGGAFNDSPVTASSYRYKAPGGGSCFGIAGGWRYTPAGTANGTYLTQDPFHINASGPGAGGTNTDTSTQAKTGAGAGEGCWRYPISVNPGDVLLLWVGLCRLYLSANAVPAGWSSGSDGMLSIEWRS